jgi:ketosteroid isomerase-like protein
MGKARIAAAAALAGIASGALAGCTQVTASETTAPAEQQALFDRIAIEDLVTRYYANLGAGRPGAFGEFYTENATFDVNGIVATGKEGIEKLYAEIGSDPDSNTAGGVFHMVLSNPVIDVKGDTATASFLWTGILNPDPKDPPRITEHGREYDKLVKRDGKWLIEHRVVIADSALPARYGPTYQPRLDYDITKE